MNPRVSFLFAGITYLIVVVIQIALDIHFDTDLFRLPSFLPWLGVAFVATVLWLTTLSIYHHLSGHKLALIFSVLHLLSAIVQYYVLYAVFSGGNYLNLYFPSYALVLGTGLLYDISLIFSVAGRLRWLRLAGVFMTVMNTILILTLIVCLYTGDAGTKATFELIHNRLSMFREVSVLFFLMNWWVNRDERHSPKIMHAAIPFITVFSGVCCLAVGGFVGTSMFSEKPLSGPREAAANSRDKAYAKRFEARTFISANGDTLLYRLMKPINCDSSRAYPLVLCLHGGAGWGTDNIKQVFGSLPAVMLSNYQVREKYPAFLVVPQISSGFSYGGVANLKVADEPVMALLTKLEAEFNIDKRRLYISGNSLGGYGTWYFIGKHPKVFAAAIPISGEGDPALAAQMADVPVWAFHGAKDINVSVEGSRRMVAALRKAGAAPKYDEYPDADHHIWNRVVNTPGLLDWLFAQRRSD